MQLFKSQCLQEETRRQLDYGYRQQVSGLRYGGRGVPAVAVATGKPQRADTVVIADFHAEPAPTRTTIRYDHAA